MEGEASRKPEFGLLGRFLSALTFAIARFPKLTILLLTISCVVSLGWTAAVLKFKTDRADLIDPSADFHQRWLRYTERFGETPDILVVVEADSRAKILSTLDTLGAALEAEPDLFTRVQWRTDPARLRAKGLQYLPPAILEFGLRQLDVFEPILEGHWERVELGAYAESLSRQIESALGQKNEARLDDALIRARQLVDSLQGFSASPTDFQSPWPEIIPASAGQGLSDLQKPQYQLSDSGTMGFLLVSPMIRDQDFAGGSASIARLREIIREFNGRDESISVGLTGIPILEADEMARSQDDMTLASILSSVIVLAIMLLGFGGLRHPMISMVMLGVGVCWSLWFATVVVGHLNILSMTFASILIGLGVDYAIHYLEHYLELRHEGLDLVPALARTAGSVGSGILTCAVATAMSFFCAALTSFQGIKELGIIAGGGVLLCVVAAFLSLPALVVLADRNVEPGRLPRPFSGVRLQRWVATAPWLMGLTAAAIVIGGGCLGFQIQDGRLGSRVVYDSNLLNMQVADAPSVVLQHRVFEQSNGSLLYGVSIADTPQEARRRKAAFEALPSVGRVVELASALPESPASRVVPLVSEFHSRLQRIPAELPPGSMNPMPMMMGLGHLSGALSAVSRNEALSAGAMLRGLLEGLKSAPPEHLGRLLIGYQYAMRMALHTQFRMLLDVADPQPASIQDLPESLRSRFVSRHGEWALQVYPAHQVWDEEPLSEFVREVRSVDPEITGTPLQNYEAARQIRDSYYDAAVFATAMIVLVLLVDFLPRGTLIIALLTPVAVVTFAAWTGASRGTPLEPKVLAAIYATVAFFVGAVFDGSSVFKTFCALLPPVAGGFMTFGIMGLTGMNLNPANMIVLPLLLGMGVDAGIYVVHDYREQTIGTGKAGRYRMSTCTINSIIMISTTTVVGFGCMIISAHRGIVSLGLTLTIGVTCSMLVSLIFLPSLLTVLDRWNSRYSLAEDVPPRAAESHAAGDVAFDGRSSVPALTRS
ncbi:MMPL family transporter [Planctomyces sp. SH-PL14]|uniref:MMPL family transporter n=1 Tax=Planctomyces sp. SH-PL14 TaxID=1632864 RepID=UPI00078B4D21|nr:MMPL family transporter [Planctomyces sp. SH-PL14]AMV17899.1 Membrane transport protein mmpL8 [Planctomyces sp. SH-PL14]